MIRKWRKGKLTKRYKAWRKAVREFVPIPRGEDYDWYETVLREYDRKKVAEFMAEKARQGITYRVIHIPATNPRHETY